MGTRRTGRLIVGLACAVLATASAAETPPTAVDRDVWTIAPARADYTAGATATLACEADGLSVVSTNAGLTIRFANFPGARPFAGMRELVVEGSCAYPGTLVAEFVSRVQSEVGRPLRLKTTFDGRVARLPLDARFDGFWRLSLLQLWPRRPKAARGLPLRWQVRRVAATFDGPALRQVELAVRTDGRAAAVWRAGDPPAKVVLANPTAVDVPRVVPLARVADGSVWSAETEATDVFAFDVRVEDDDGRGVDAWLSLSEGRAAPTVRLGGPDSD